MANETEVATPKETPEQELVRLRKVVSAAEDCVLLGETSIIEEGDPEDCALLHDITELYQDCEETREELYEANRNIEDLAEYIRALRWDTEVNNSVGSWIFALPSCGREEFVTTQREAREALIRAQSKDVFIESIPVVTEVKRISEAANRGKEGK